MITINGEEWRIKFCSPTHPALRKYNGDYTIGSCDDKTKTIYICHLVEGTLLKKVLCHEITHAVLFSYNITLGAYQEEILADLLATYGREIIDMTEYTFYNINE